MSASRTAKVSLSVPIPQRAHRSLVERAGSEAGNKRKRDASAQRRGGKHQRDAGPEPGSGPAAGSKSKKHGKEHAGAGSKDGKRTPEPEPEESDSDDAEESSSTGEEPEEHADVLRAQSARKLGSLLGSLLEEAKTAKEPSVPAAESRRLESARKRLRVEAEAKAEQLAKTRETNKLKRAIQERGRKIPDAATDLEQERRFARTATQGVVALFNAVNKYQRASAQTDANAGSGSTKQREPAMSKENFLKLLKGEAIEPAHDATRKGAPVGKASNDAEQQHLVETESESEEDSEPQDSSDLSDDLEVQGEDEEEDEDEDEDEEEELEEE